MTKTFTQYPGASLPAALRKGMASLLVASFVLATTTTAHADVFGTAKDPQAAAQSTALLARLTALEAELKDLKEKGPGATAGTSASGKAGTTAKVKAKPKVAPPPGMEDLPGGGADERERLLVEKELTYEVMGTINGMLFVRDGDSKFVMSPADFADFEKKKRQKVVLRMKTEAASEGETRLSFPQLTPPPPPVGSAELTQVGIVVDPAHAAGGNVGQVLPPPPLNKPAMAPMPAAGPTPGHLNAAAPASARPPAVAPLPGTVSTATPVPGQAKPASPVKKN